MIRSVLPKAHCSGQTSTTRYRTLLDTFTEYTARFMDDQKKPFLAKNDPDDQVDPQSSDASPDNNSEDYLDSLIRKPDTAILPNKNILRRFSSPIQISGDTSSLSQMHEIILVIRGMVERIEMKAEKPITLGRSDMRTRFVPDIDLTPYGALERGVSREHAQLHLEGDHLFITDLESTNGTFIGSKRLEPRVPAQIHKGDELLLGRLAVQILFR
jgi:hypothetical protein